MLLLVRKLEVLYLLLAVAFNLGAGFVPVRKPKKLPYEKISMSYVLEYGTDTLEMHKDGVRKEPKVLMVDDLLATGGTMAACCKMVESLGGNIVGCAFLIELAFLNGKKEFEQVRYILTYKILKILQLDLSKYYY